jgi:hypothetical protein
MRFSAANAREMAARSLAKRKANEAARAIQPAPIPLISDAVSEYESGQVAQVRAHIKRTDEWLNRTKDAQDYERLARSRGLFAEQERIARGKPLPGQYRPEKQRVMKRPEVEPL